MSLLLLITNLLSWVADQLTIKMIVLGAAAIIVLLSLIETAIISCRNKNGKIYRTVKAHIRKNGEIDELKIGKFVKSVGKKFPKKERKLLKLYMMSGEAYNASTLPLAISEMATKKAKSPKLTFRAGVAVIFVAQSLLLIAGETWATVFVISALFAALLGLLCLIGAAIRGVAACVNESNGKKLEKLMSRYIVVGRGRLAPVVDLSKLDCKLSGSGVSSVNKLTQSLDSFVDSCPDKSIAQIVEQGLNNCNFGKELTAQEKDYFDRAMQRLKNFCS
ncbi:MAG: hypothetical protein ACI4MI_03205 [Christensenellales bacterium]